MGKIGAPTQQRTGDFDLSRAQDFIARHFRSLQNLVPFLDGAAVGPISLSTTPKTVPHPLGRVPRGVFPLDCQASGAVGVVLRGVGDASNVTLSLSTGSGPATLTLWIW